MTEYPNLCNDEPSCCAPELRQRIAELQAEVDTLTGLLASLEDTIAAAHRNSDLPNPAIRIGDDLREYVWQLSYKANNNKYRAVQAEAVIERVKALPDSWRDDPTPGDAWDCADDLQEALKT